MPEITQTDRPQRKKKRRKPKPGDPVPMPAWLFFPFWGCALAAALMLFRRGDPVTAATVVGIAFSGWIGFRMGLGRIVATVLAMVAAISLAPDLGIRFESRFSDQFGTTGLANRFLCIATIGVLISMVVTVVVAVISNHFLKTRRKLNLANSYLGFGVGLLEGVAIAWLVLGGLLSMQAWQRGMDVDNNKVASFVDKWAATTRQSAIGPIIRDSNPFEKISLLAGIRDVQDSVRHFSDPQKIREILNDPKIAEMRSDPAIAAALDELRGDPSVKEMIDQDLPLDREGLIRLMNSPSVMNLVDQPEFRRRVRELIGVQ